MYYVYLIQSIAHPERKYIGYTTNIKRRLTEHNSGVVASTKDALPWEVVVCLCFEDTHKALAFEKYLKTGSGSAFAHKRFW